MKNLVIFVLFNIIFIPNAMADGLVIKDAWSRPTAPKSRTGAIYLTIQNHSDIDDRLTGASTNVAGETEIHQTSVQDGVARMRHITEIELPARQMVLLAPEKMHLMLKQLMKPLVTGQIFVVRLQFAHSSDIHVQVRVTSTSYSDNDKHKNTVRHTQHD
tara:strand:- start:2274 stop:2750 length:477 start_codon:yes stop_codon:yes gene_type:complete